MASIRFHLPGNETAREAIARGARDAENEWGGLVRPHVLFMSGEHAANTEKLIEATGGEIVARQVNRDQWRYL